MLLVSTLSAQPIRLTAPATLVSGESPVLPSYWAPLRVLPLNDGSLLVVHVAGGRIDRVFANGATRNVARVGDGPGEFRMISAAGILGDTLWVVDEVHRRLTYLPRIGTGKPVTISLGSGASSGAVYLPFTLADGGRAWALAIADDMTFNMQAVRHVPVVHTTRAGVKTGAQPLADSLDVWSRTHRIELPGRRSVSFRAQLFTDRSLVAASPNGRYWVTVNQPDVSEAPGGRREVALWTGAGQRAARVPIPLPVERFDRADRERQIDSVIDAMDGALRQRGARGTIARAFKQRLFSPQVRTPVTDVLVTDDGLVLLRGNDWGRTTVTYAMLDRTGAVVGRFVVPASQVVKTFTRTRLWSLLKDEDGEVRLVVQQLLQ